MATETFTLTLDNTPTESVSVTINDTSTGKYQLAYTLDNPNAYDTSASDRFGHAVDIHGNYAIIGAYFEGDADGGRSGKAYVFNVTTGSLVATLDNPNAYGTGASDQFGWDVAISSSYAVVGAPGEDDTDGSNQGKAYVYATSDWSLDATLDNPNGYNTPSSDQFGYRVAAEGNYVWVSAPSEDDAGGNQSGKVYVYRTNVVPMTLDGTINNINSYSTGGGDNFGWSIALNKAGLDYPSIIGAYGEDEPLGNTSGRAYFVKANRVQWIPRGVNNPNGYDTPTGDEFGRNVDVYGNYAIVGAHGEDDANGTTSGKAYIFDVTDSSGPVFTLNNPNDYGTSADDRFGWAVAITENYAMVGAYGEASDDGNSSGTVYVFKTTAGDWSDTTLVQTIENPNIVNGDGSIDQFGYVLKMHGSYAVIGALGTEDDGGTFSGKAYIYKV